MSHALHCHRCSHFVGEAREPMELVGLFKVSEDRQQISGPRDSWRCPSCKWINVFRKVTVRAASWRAVELKR